MNLAEIRKKARQEKVEEPCAVPPPAGNERAEEPAAVSGPAGPGPETTAPSPIEEERLAVPVKPDAPVLHDIDPIAVIMAGRAAVRGGDAAGRMEELRVDDDGAGFRELLCFRVAAEKYAVDIMDIREIIKPRELTEVPRMPGFVSGVLSLRGVIIPVFDMHRRLGHAVAGESGKERIVVVRRGEELCGVLVDEVIQVARLDAAALEPPPAVLDGIDRDFVGGIGRIDGKMMILLNLERILDMNLH